MQLKFQILMVSMLMFVFAQNATAQNELFPASLLKDFLKWDPVLPNDQAYESEGHGGILVKVHFNEIAASVYKGSGSIPFPEGSIIAKARVASPETPASQASRVYFMRKMSSTYDPQNNNWAYGFADLKNGKYVFNPEVGKVGLCISCHQNYSNFDYVKSLDIYKGIHQ